MKDQIEELRHSIESILLNEQITDEWVRGRHSAFRGVKIKLDEILNLSQSKEALTLGNQEEKQKHCRVGIFGYDRQFCHRLPCEKCTDFK